ncbi:MAG: methylated-DNA--[Lachnospiraceae bacterium]|nr:methylated-DNA--[protein]-cysteine S-methyltransferase [Lachnospiraceae bacterium]
MTTREEALSAALLLPDTYTDIPFHDPNWVLVRVKGSKKAFLWTYEKDGLMNATVKVDPSWRDFYRDLYPAVTAAYHMNKEHWSNIALDGSVPEDVVIRMIQESYDLVTDSPAKRIYEAVKKVPKGKVATYGDIAALAGNPRMSRAVGNALHKNPDPSAIPCHRVVSSAGKLSGAFAFGGPDVQAKRLRAEGVEVRDNRVDLSEYRIDAAAFLLDD